MLYPQPLDDSKLGPGSSINVQFGEEQGHLSFATKAVHVLWSFAGGAIILKEVWIQHPFKDQLIAIPAKHIRAPGDIR